jgi:hypothetical protein
MLRESYGGGQLGEWIRSTFSVPYERRVWREKGGNEIKGLEETARELRGKVDTG